MIDNTEYLKLYRELGFNVLPCNAETKFPNLPEWKPYKTKKYDGVIKQTDELCMITGESSNGVIVIDLDDRSLATDIFSDWQGLLKNTLVHESGKGYHVFVKPTGLIPPNMRIKDAKERRIDIQSNSLIVVLPPSIHKSGKPYKIISSSREIMSLDFGKLVDHLREKGFNVDKKRFEINKVKNGVSEGERNNDCFYFAMFLRREYNLSYDTVLFWMREWNKLNKPPMRDSELVETVKSVFRYGQIYGQKERPYDASNFSMCGTLEFSKVMATEAVKLGVGVDDLNIRCNDCNMTFKYKQMKTHNRHYVTIETLI